MFLRAGSLCAPHSAIPTKNTAPLNSGASSMYTLADEANTRTEQKNHHNSVRPHRRVRIIPKLLNTSPPLCGTWCKWHCGRGEFPTPSSSTAEAQSRTTNNRGETISQIRMMQRVIQCEYAPFSHLPAGFTKLLEVDSST